MVPLERWPWFRTLATAGPGRWVVVQHIVLGTVERQCQRVGIREGDVLRCVTRGNATLLLEDTAGKKKRISRSYAWFIGTGEPSQGPVSPG